MPAAGDRDLNLEVDEICASLAKGSPQGLRETKLLVGRHLLARIEEQGADLARLSARLFGSEEARERMLAFLDRGRR